MVLPTADDVQGSVDDLAARLWGDGPPPTARTIIQGVVSRLRRHLATDGPVRIDTVPDGYHLRTTGEGAASPIDVRRFRALVEQGVVEVTLLGQNVNTYGVEFGDRLAFGKPGAQSAAAATRATVTEIAPAGVAVDAGATFVVLGAGAALVVAGLWPGIREEDADAIKGFRRKHAHHDLDAIAANHADIVNTLALDLTQQLGQARLVELDGDDIGIGLLRRHGGGRGAGTGSNFHDGLGPAAVKPGVEVNDLP